MPTVGYMISACIILGGVVQVHRPRYCVPAAGERTLALTSAIREHVAERWLLPNLIGRCERLQDNRVISRSVGTARTSPPAGTPGWRYLRLRSVRGQSLLMVGEAQP